MVLVIIKAPRLHKVFLWKALARPGNTGLEDKTVLDASDELTHVLGHRLAAYYG